MQSWRPVAQWLLIAFCAWHMAAVGLYAIPTSVTDPGIKGMRDLALPLIRPYILLTSQWQQWNLFSPDPLRRVVNYHIEAQEHGTWKTVNIIAPQTLPWWRNAYELKFTANLEDDTDSAKQLRGQYLLNQCALLGLAPGTPVQLTFLYYVMPQTGGTWWRTFRPQWTRTVGATTSCPSV